MLKIAQSVQQTGLFVETQLVGVRGPYHVEKQVVADGVSIIRLRGTTRRGALGQLLRAALWQPRVYLRYRKTPVDVVAAHNIWVFPLCWLLSIATGGDLIYNPHELETETGTMRGARQHIAKRIESFLVKRCAVISVVNESIASWYAQAYAIPCPVIVGNVPIAKDGDVRLRQRLDIADDEMLYIHTGFLVEGRNIPLILSSFAGRSEHVVFLGDGPLREAVLAAGATSPNIHWLAPVHPDQIVAHVREADVGLCLIDAGRDLSDNLSSPNKLLEALAADIPPLCTDLVEARKLLGPLAGDWIIEDPQTELTQALDRLGKEDVESFRKQWPGLQSWSVEVEPLLDAYRRVVTRRVRSSAAAVEV